MDGFELQSKTFEAVIIVEIYEFLHTHVIISIKACVCPFLVVFRGVDRADSTLNIPAKNTHECFLILLNVFLCYYPDPNIISGALSKSCVAFLLADYGYIFVFI